VNDIEIRVTSKDDSKAGMDSATGRTRLLGDAVRSTSEKVRTLGDTIKAAFVGRAAEASESARRLNTDIRATEHSLKELAARFAETRDESLLGDIDKHRAKLRQLLDVRRLMGEAGRDGGEEFSLSFAQKVGPLMARAPISPQLVAAAAAAAPEIASLLGAAVSGGVGLGVAAIGAKLAASDDRVKAAGARLGELLGEGLKADAGVFVGPLLRNIDRAEAKFEELRPIVRDIFDTGARNADTFLKGMIDGADEVVKDLRDINRSSEPAVNVLGRQIPDAAHASTSALKQLTAEAEFNAKTLDVAFSGLSATIAGTGLGLRVLNEAAKYSTLGIIVDQIGSADPAAEDAAAAQRELAEAIKATRDRIAAEEAAIRGQIAALRDMENATGNAERAGWDLRDSIAGLGKQVDENGRSLDEHTIKGRANLRYLDDAVRKADDAGQAAEDLALAQGQSATAAAASGAMIRRTWIADLAAAAAKAGFNRTEIAKMVAAAKAADGTRIRMYFDQQIRTFGRPIITGPGGFHGYSKGGPIKGSGPRGVDSELVMAAPDEHVWTAAEVDAAGGHAAVKAMRQAVLSGGSRGHTGAYPPAGRGPMAGWSGPYRSAEPQRVQVEVLVSAAPNMSTDFERVLLRHLRFVVRTEGGGNVQSALGRTVGVG
jgi:hypothetical protein